MNPNDPDINNPDQILACYLIINGTLGMSAGKIACQTFQACQRLLRAADQGACTPEQLALLREWEADGTRTITRIAETSTAWERCKTELDGILMIDEGIYGCDPDSETVIALWPIRRGDAPSLLRHKRVPLMTDAVPAPAALRLVA